MEAAIVLLHKVFFGGMSRGRPPWFCTAMDSLKPNDLFHHYLLVRKIAWQDKQGTRTVIWLATSTRGVPCAVAVKIQRAKVAKEITALVARVNNEAVILHASGKHPNVVEFVETFETETGEIVIVFKYYSGGSLIAHVEREIIRHLNTSRRVIRSTTYPSGLQIAFVQKVFWQMVNGIHHMHSQGVAHMDIKLENTCLDDLGDAVIIDWEFALLVLADGPDAYMYRIPCGTPGYAPPEVFFQLPYDPRGVDVWCLGVCLYCLVFGEMPFPPPNPTPEDSFRTPLRFLEPTNEDLESLLSGMLEIVPENRMTLFQVKKHPALCYVAPHLRRDSEEGCESGAGTPRSSKSSSDTVNRNDDCPLVSTEGIEAPEAGVQTTSPRTAGALFSILKRVRNRIVKPTLTVTSAE